MVRIISFSALSFLSFLYAVGFIYDTGYLIEFGYDSVQLPASPQEYLVFGSVFVLNGVAKKFIVFFYACGIVASGYKPFVRTIKNSKISDYIDVESLPYILIATILPLLLLSVGTIFSAGKNEASQFKTTAPNQEITYYQGSNQHTAKGAILRNRDHLLLFYDSNKKQTLLIPHSKVLKNVATSTNI